MNTLYSTKVMGNGSESNEHSLNHSVYKAQLDAAIKAKKQVKEKTPKK